MLLDLTMEDLKSLGLSLAKARIFKKEADALSAPASPALAPPTSSVTHPPSAAAPAAAGGAAAPVPAMSCPADERTLLTSEFKRSHDAAECPELQHELFGSIHCFIMGMCERHSVPSAAGKDLFHRLQGESFENPRELLSQVQVAATRIWTSTQKLQGAGVDKALNVEFCSLINRALREDAADVMQHLVVIVRVINALCIVRRESSSLKFPPDDVSHRGGALPSQHRNFFAVGKKYRVPMYLATSFSEDKAYKFWCVASTVARLLASRCLMLVGFRYRAFASGQAPVHWVVHFDARGKHNPRYRCKNVNLVEKTVKGVEDELEFLFVPRAPPHALFFEIAYRFALQLASPYAPPPPSAATPCSPSCPSTFLPKSRAATQLSSTLRLRSTTPTKTTTSPSRPGTDPSHWQPFCNKS